jgi:30S ribosomal protein S31
LQKYYAGICKKFLLFFVQNILQLTPRNLYFFTISNFSVGLQPIIFKKEINPIMGRGDKKTKKGKIFMGSFGKVRPARTAKPATGAANAAETKEVEEVAAAKPAKKSAKKED